MTRTHRYLCGLVPSSAALALAIGAIGSVPAHAASCAASPSAVLKQNAAAARKTKTLLASTSYTPVVRTFTPRPTSTKGFTGYATIVVKSPKGTGPVVGYFTRVGGKSCGMVVTSAGVVMNRSAYVVKLKFPGEQGNPGKLKITLVSR